MDWKKISITLILTLLLASVFVFPVVADTYTHPTSYGNGYSLTLPTETPTFNQYQDKYLKTWVNQETGQLDLTSMFWSIQSPFSNILGQFLYLILYALAIFSIWQRSGNIALVTITLGVSLGFWYALFPKDSWWVAVLIMAIGITAILFRLFKRR